jgi:hypothetical protein
MAPEIFRKIEFYLHVAEGEINDFCLMDNLSQRLPFQFKRRTPSLLGDFFALQIHQNIRLNQLSRRDRVFLLKHFVVDLLTNARFYLHQILHTYRCSVQLEIFTLGGIRIVSDSSNLPIWVSRESVASGIYTENLARTLEFDRQKNIHGYSAFLNLKPVSIKDIFLFIVSCRDLQRVQTLSKSEISDEIMWVEPKKGEREIQVLSNSEVRHGRAVVYQNELHILKLHEFENFKRWPETFVLTDDNSALVLSSRNQTFVDEAMFCGVAENWYHFVIEVLTKVYTCLEDSPVPLILPSNLAPQQYDAVRFLTGMEPIQLSNLDSITVGKLRVCKDGVSKSIYDFSYLKTELLSIRMKILNHLPVQSDLKSKIFIRRRPTLGRPLQNSKAIEDFLVGLGFLSVYPENLTFLEQAELFSGANVLVLESGAAFTNVMFCKNGAHIIELHPGIGDEFFWQGYADQFDLNHHRLKGGRKFFGVGGFRIDGFSIRIETDLKPILNEIL